jgi:hypothetical protein
MPPAVERGERVAGQDLVTRHGVDEHAFLPLTATLDWCVSRSYYRFMELVFQDMEHSGDEEATSA